MIGNDFCWCFVDAKNMSTLKCVGVLKIKDLVSLKRFIIDALENTLILFILAFFFLRLIFYS